jgi:hypothetical protein
VPAPSRVTGPGKSARASISFLVAGIFLVLNDPNQICSQRIAKRFSDEIGLQGPEQFRTLFISGLLSPIPLVDG